MIKFLFGSIEKQENKYEFVNIFQGQGQGQGFGGQNQDDSWDRVKQIRDKFEYDRENRMKGKGLWWFQYLLCLILNSHLLLFSIFNS